MPTVKGSSGLLSKDVELHYEDTGGTGRPVVLIHGWPLSGRSWADQVPALTEAGYRVVTYDRRGFGESDKPEKGYDYDTFADDLKAVVEELDLRDASLVGFSMGGGEVARYIGRHGTDRVHSAVFASAIPPFLLKSDDHPDGGLDKDTVAGMQDDLRKDPPAFFDGFTTGFFSAGDELKVSEAQRQEALGLAAQADPEAAAQCIAAWVEDFRDDLAKVDVPTLVIHGDSDGTVPFEVSGQRTHDAVAGSELHVVKDGPHGINVSHKDEFNSALLTFLAK
ncbi:bromoperoxidase [Phycicoccus sp. Root563]|jgi:pimeloyl-ACP methyl ester carboxylesterase|uniref:alpha/beta fold hydrolase n=1 Tax=unclassified Phycicoccus TaxID=2637926 RepID=UPI0007028D57|nr:MULTISPECIES: alpha/beta hydrolase [unclassified Phycicoccus]KQU68467.1 bromoperoxidase [Phycicoccus sp. Root101]KQZ87962.1 bromoperoxidase [Phycicoccus sp. Root563]